MDIKYPNIAKAMSVIMDQHGGNKAAVARALRSNATSVGYWLTGDRLPVKPGHLAMIAKESGKTIAWLMGGGDTDDDTTPQPAPDAIDVRTLSPAQKAVWDRILNLPDDKLEKVLGVVELFWSEVQKDKRDGS